ncbi:MAG: TRAP transporter small permease [Alphaproteobacteria bacterium]|nr:TRAP transporter small permease [Alphaproteobacteria bacterium]
MRILVEVHQRIVTAFAILAGAVVTAMTLALIVNVAFRAAGEGGLFGMVDAIELGLMAATFLAAPWVLRRNGHVAVDIFLITLPEPARRRLTLVMMVFGALMSAVLSWSSITALITAVDRGSMVRGILVFPEWIPLMAPSIAGVLLAVEFILKAAARPDVERMQTGL